VMAWAQQAAGARFAPWAWGWWALALACVAATAVMLWPARVMRPWLQAGQSGAAQASALSASSRHHWRHLLPALAAYSCFGMGYIGYMTFVIALLRQQGSSAAQVTVFYALLGIACILSAPLWARLLRLTDGKPLAVLNALLGVATLIAASSNAWGWMLVSGVMFGACFLQLVGSTTALVRHQWPAAMWAQGIALFTIVFAAGQIVGPALVGWISDGAGGLQKGLKVSALILWAGALLACWQKPPVR
jgi:predicted MFS family arabinose efflux permease